MVDIVKRLQICQNENFEDLLTNNQKRTLFEMYLFLCTIYVLACKPRFFGHFLIKKRKGRGIKVENLIGKQIKLKIVV
jgi:hypothetical protein